MRIDAIEVVRVLMPLVRPFRTSFGTQHHREVLLVHVLADTADGWGEAAAHAEPFYNEEFTDAAAIVVERWLAPAAFEATVHGTEIAAAFTHVKGFRAAKAGVEMAILDAELKSTGIPMSSMLGGTRTSVDVGVSIGITATIEELLQQIHGYVDQGYRRVKLKIMPGWDVDEVAIVRSEFPDLALQVDANAGYDSSALERLTELDRFGLLMIEQPFAPDELELHASLAAKMATPICLDESILSVRSAEAALDAGACQIVNVKVGRVGGAIEARRIHDTCVARGVPAWVGGMLETGVGRAANVALASLPGFTFPADLSASDRYWRRDITVESFDLIHSTLRVPAGAGLGVTVDDDALSELGAQRTMIVR